MLQRKSYATKIGAEGVGVGQGHGRLVLEEGQTGNEGCSMDGSFLGNIPNADKGGDLLPARAINARGCAYLSSTSAPASSS
jgi:hypothetical protein